MKGGQEEERKLRGKRQEGKLEEAGKEGNQYIIHRSVF